MKGAWHLGVVAGIPLRLHWSFFLVLIWSGYLGYRAAGAGAVVYSVTLTVVLFLCVFLHELGHALAARRYGVGTRSITLLPIGGVAALERIPERPREELVIALAGPLVNVVIALVLIGWIGWPDEARFARLGSRDWGEFPDMVLLLNLVMIGFNMIPAFPMDGGRVLRAVLAMGLRYGRATAVASVIGQGFAVVMVVAGFSTNPFLSLIGVMVFLGARAESRMVHLRSALSGVTVGDIMVAPPPILSPDAGVEDCLDAWRWRGDTDFLIVEEGRVVGVLDAAAWRAHGQDAERGWPVRRIMERPVVMVRPDMPVTALCDLVRSGHQTVYPVVMGADLLGLVSRARVLAIMQQGWTSLRAEVRDGEAVAPVVRPVTGARRGGGSWLDVG